MKKMRLALMFVALAAISAESFAAMSLSDIRREARFLTDRMGHELGLSNRQFEDVYEINFDFLYQVNEVIDDVVYGYDDAIDYYYYLLDMRNEDLMYVLRNNQYRRFVNRDYFYRPLYMVGHTWGMRIWTHYADRNYFYFGTPVSFTTYIGAHNRVHFTLSYYANRYTHKLYHGAFRLWGGGYHHHVHDGWVVIGKKKHTHPNTRPWSNAKNYEKSRRDLKEGFVYVPSRDTNKRKVKVSSEENRRTAVTSETPTRTSNSTRNNASTDTSTRKTNAVRSSERGSGTSRNSSASRNGGASRSSSANSGSVTRTNTSNSTSSNANRNAGSTSSTSRSSASGVSRSSAGSSSSATSRTSSSSVTRNVNSSNSSSVSRNASSKNTGTSGAARTSSSSRSSSSSVSSSRSSSSRSSNSNSSRSSSSRSR